ncbi:hypothetical protein, partial [Mangrovicoccus sp. HB161399]|uniref:hypothetical protein n=1 Tax=Mangrovicoccus sp. HB161399 TaxID=2720392 RepID=UPI001C13068E
GAARRRGRWRGWRSCCDTSVAYGIGQILRGGTAETLHLATIPDLPYLLVRAMPYRGTARHITFERTLQRRHDPMGEFDHLHAAYRRAHDAFTEIDDALSSLIEQLGKAHEVASLVREGNAPGQIKDIPVFPNLPPTIEIRALIFDWNIALHALRDAYFDLPVDERCLVPDLPPAANIAARGLAHS